MVFMIRLNNIHLSFGGQVVLDDANLAVRDGECVAVVGPNGCGKSTLLKVMAGAENPDGGQVQYPVGSLIGYLPQEATFDVDHSLQYELLEAFKEVRQAQADLKDCEQEMAEQDPMSDDYQKIIERYADLSHFVEQHDGYNLESQVARVAAGLGFSVTDMERSCRVFSGGWRMRILLAKLLLRAPDIILLDEPTNHLDLESIIWLEQWIRTCETLLKLINEHI